MMYIYKASWHSLVRGSVLQCVRCLVLPCVAVLQCLAMCCSVAVSCHVLQCCSALPCVAVLQCVAMCCSVAVCCHVLQCCSVLPPSFFLALSHFPSPPPPSLSSSPSPFYGTKFAQHLDDFFLSVSHYCATRSCSVQTASVSATAAGTDEKKRGRRGTKAGPGRRVGLIVKERWSVLLCRGCTQPNLQN